MPVKLVKFQIWINRDFFLWLLNQCFEDAKNPKAVLKVEMRGDEPKIYSEPVEV